MPRQARLDYPGALNHVIGRGVARGRIFDDARDYERFEKDLSELVIAASARCLAWALLPNHFHLLVRTGRRPLKWLMQHLLTRHALHYNRRHRRVGHLFQNRYRSILCQDDPYLAELARYIHLNPLRAGRVSSMRELARHRWCGHGAVLGLREAGWQAVEDVLAVFGSVRSRARKAYLAYVAEGVGTGRREEYSGGRMPEGTAGAEGIVAMARRERGGRNDERILGSGRFVARVLREVERRDRRKMGLRRKLTPAGAVERAAKVVGTEARCVYARDRRRMPSAARALACKWLVEDMGVSVASVARMLKVTMGAVCQAVARGRAVEDARGTRLS